MLADARATTLLAQTPPSPVLTDARATTLLALLPLSPVLADARATTLLASTPLSPPAVLAHPILHIDRSLVLLRATVLLAPLAPSGSLATRRERWLPLPTVLAHPGV